MPAESTGFDACVMLPAEDNSRLLPHQLEHLPSVGQLSTAEGLSWPGHGQPPVLFILKSGLALAEAAFPKVSVNSGLAQGA